jgi:hypothetical protein
MERLKVIQAQEPHTSELMQVQIFMCRPVIFGHRLKYKTHKGMVRSDMSKPALFFFIYLFIYLSFLLQEYTQQNPLSKF